MNRLRELLAERNYDLHKEDFVWHDDAGNIFIIPAEDDNYWDSIDYVDEDDWFWNWEEAAGVYMVSPMIKSNKIINDLLTWNQRRIKISGWRNLHIEDPRAGGCPYCPPNRGCNSSPYRFKRKNWKQLRKTQYQ